MTDNAEITRVEELLAREQKNYDYLVSFLDQVQQKSMEARTAGDRNQLTDFDRTAIRTCNKELSALESVDSPTHEQKQLIKRLDEFSVLLDVAVNRALVLRDEQRQADIRAAYPASEGAPSGSESGSSEYTPSLSRRSNSAKSSPSSVETAASSNSRNGCIGSDDPYGASGGLGGFAAQPGTGKSVIDELPPHTPVVPGASDPTEYVAAKLSSTNLGETAQSKSSEAKNFTTPTAESSSNAGTKRVGPDPLGLYAELDLLRDAPLPAIQKAIKRKMLTLHPDRFPTDSDGSRHQRYTNFTSRFRLFDKEKGRAAYDEIETEEDLDAVKAKYV